MDKIAHAGPQAPIVERAAHLRDYWRIVRRGRYTILVIFLIAVGLSILRVTLATPIYKATATIEVKPEPRRILPGQEQWVGAEGGGWIAEEKYFNTQLEVLRSRDVAEKTFRRLHLERHPLFANTQDPVAVFQRMIEVRPKIETRLVFVSVTGPNSKEIKEWVNAVADVYVKRNVQQAMESFSAIMDEIRRGMEAFRGGLEQADSRRLEIAAEEDLYLPENQQEILKRRLEAYNEQLSTARIEVGSLNAEIEGLERIRREGGDILSLSRCAQDPVIQDLYSQKLQTERDLQRLGGEKRPNHPEYLAKVGESKKIQESLAAQLDVVLEKLRTQQRVKASESSFALEQIRTTQAEAYRVQQVSSSYDISKNDAEAKRKAYDVVAETMERLTVGAQLVGMNNNLSVLDRAIEPARPSKPRRLVSLLFGSLVGLILGIGAVLFMDYLDNTVRTAEDVEQYLGLRLLAIVPRKRDSNAHAIKEAYQSLRTSILFSSEGRERKILLVSSAGPQEGKSSTVAAVARTFAATGEKVVVIDCDLRKPTQHVHMSVPREPGLTNFLLDGKGADVRQYLRTTDVDSLRLLPCGPIPPNPPDIVGSLRFRELLSELKETFDWVIVDSPPVVSLADSLVLASMADLVVLVIKHNENDRELIRRSVKQLRDINANMVGAVLNNVDIERAHYGDYYYAGYYNYGEAGGKGAKRRRSRAREAAAGGDGSERVAL